MSNLYFKQLLAGRDFGVDDPFAAQMENFVYLIGDLETRQCVVVDPAWSIAEIVSLAQADGMKIVGALATHYHPDHVGGTIFGHAIQGLSTLMEIAPCKVHAHQLEIPGIMQVTGLSLEDFTPHVSGDEVLVGSIPIKILHTPGHTPGSLCFLLGDALISGDTLFLNGCGRVDLPGGNLEDMYATLTQKLAVLPNHTCLYPGHCYGGEHALMSHVKTTNPMMQVHSLAVFKRIRGLTA